MGGFGLDTSGEPWVAVFPGLGRVLIDVDGDVTTELEPHDGTETDQQRSDALLHGWGAPLAHVRRGRRLVIGAGLVDPAGRCLLASSVEPELADVVVALVERGWSVLADRMQPVAWTDDGLVAHPGGSPTLLPGRLAVPVAERLACDSHPARPDTDSHLVELPRHDTPCRITGIVQVRARRGPEAPVRRLTGFDRFEACGRLFIGTEFCSPPTEPRAAMSDTIRLTALPHVLLTGRRGDVPLDDLLAWWEEVQP